MKRLISIVVSLALVLSIMLVNVGAVDASTLRFAKISSFEGTIEVQKAGGKRIMQGYKNMILYEGDILSTGNNGSAVLTFSNGTSEDDSIILENNTTITLNKLTTVDGTITKIKLKKGKAWVDVRSIKQETDKFEVAIPTANIDVRGTNFVITTDPVSNNSYVGVFSGIVNYLSNNFQSNSSKYIYPTQMANITTENQNVGMMSNSTLEQLLASTPTNVAQAIVAKLKIIEQENMAMISDSIVDSSSIDSSAKERIKENINKIVFALLKELLDANLISQEVYEKELANLQVISGDTQSQSTLEGSDEFPNDFDIKNNQLTQQHLDRIKQIEQEKVERLKQLQEQRAAQQRLELEKKRQANEAKLLSNMTPEQRQAYLLRNRDLLGIQEPESSPSPAPAPTPEPIPEPTPEPTPEQTVSWNDYALPLQLQLVESGNTSELIVIYDETTDSYQFAQPMSVTKGASLRMKPKFLDALEVIEVKVNDKNVEINTETKSYHIEVETVPTTFRISYKVKHAQLGERNFELNLNLHKKTMGWTNVEQPIHITYENNTSTKEISYRFDKQEQAGAWSGNMQGEGVHGVKGTTNIQFSALDGFTISEVAYDGEVTTGDTITIAEPNGQTDVIVNLKLAHDDFGEIRVTVMMSFINENEVPFQIFKGNDALEVDEYQKVVLDNQSYLPIEVRNELNTLRYYVKLRETVEFVSLYKYSPEELDPFQLESDSEGRYWITVHDGDWDILNDGGSVYYELTIKDPQTLEDKIYRIYLKGTK